MEKVFDKLFIYSFIHPNLSTLLNKHHKLNIFFIKYVHVYLNLQCHFTSDREMCILYNANYKFVSESFFTKQMCILYPPKSVSVYVICLVYIAK